MLQSANSSPPPQAAFSSVKTPSRPGAEASGGPVRAPNVQLASGRKPGTLQGLTEGEGPDTAVCALFWVGRLRRSLLPMQSEAAELTALDWLRFHCLRPSTTPRRSSLFPGSQFNQSGILKFHRVQQQGKGVGNWTLQEDRVDQQREDGARHSRVWWSVCQQRGCPVRYLLCHVQGVW